MAEGGGAPPPEARRGGVSKTIVVIVAVVIALVGFFAGVAAGPVLFPAKAPQPVLVVGTNTPFPPFEYYDVNNNLIGFDIDLTNAVAAKLGYTVVWRDFQDFTALLTAVQFSGVDMAASSITSSGPVGTTRNATMTFSSMYYLSNQGVLVPIGSSITCASTGCQPSNLANKTIALQTGTSSDFWVQDNLISTNLSADSMITRYPDVTQVIQALKSGAVQAVIIDLPIAQNVAATNSATLKVAGTIYTNEQYSFAFPKTAAGEGLRDKVNNALSAMKSDGSFQTIFNKWFAPAA